jgi:predicted ArsR family transcriptional regulator
VTGHDLDLANRVVFDTIAPDRSAVLELLNQGMRTRGAVGKALGKSSGHVWQVFNELIQLGMIKEQEPNGNRATGRPAEEYALVAWVNGLIPSATLDPVTDLED